MGTSCEQINERIRENEGKGYQLWNDHPGQTIVSLNEMLIAHGLTILIMEDKIGLWFKISPIKEIKP